MALGSASRSLQRKKTWTGAVQGVSILAAAAAPAAHLVVENRNEQCAREASDNGAEVGCCKAFGIEQQRLHIRPAPAADTLKDATLEASKKTVLCYKGRLCTRLELPELRQRQFEDPEKQHDGQADEDAAHAGHVVCPQPVIKQGPARERSAGQRVASAHASCHPSQPGLQLGAALHSPHATPIEDHPRQRHHGIELHAATVEAQQGGALPGPGPGHKAGMHLQRQQSGLSASRRPHVGLDVKAPVQQRSLNSLHGA